MIRAKIGFDLGTGDDVEIQQMSYQASPACRELFRRYNAPQELCLGKRM